MKQKIRNTVLAIAIALSGGMVMVPAIASADTKDDACQGINALDGTGGSKCDASAEDTVHKILVAVIRILSFVVGFVAVLMVIVGGLKYMTANGDSGAMASARSTIIYALVGLVIVAVAQILVHFVLNRTGAAVAPPPGS